MNPGNPIYAVLFVQLIHAFPSDGLATRNLRSSDAPMVSLIDPELFGFLRRNQNENAVKRAAQTYFAV